MKYLLVFIVFLNLGKINSQIIVESSYDSIALENELELSDRPYRSEFDSKDKATLEFIFKKIENHKKEELEIFDKFKLFLSEEDNTPFNIIYTFCDVVLKEYNSDLLLEYIWENSDLFRINMYAIRGHLQGDILATYPLRTFISDHKRLFINYLVSTEYFSKEIPDKDLPSVYTVLKDYIEKNGELVNKSWITDNKAMVGFKRINIEKIKDYHNKYKNQR